MKVATMKEQDRLCALIFDEMSIRNFLSYNKHGDFIEGFEDLGVGGTSQYVANHALAFMVRGLSSKWKQCIGYFLSSGPVSGKNLQILIKEAIDKLSDIGLTVKVTICDQGSNNRNFVHTLEGVSVDKPYFEHNSKKVFVMYDPPHLLKNVRNNLKNTGFLYKGKPVKWEHISQFYDYDKNKKIRLAPKLTDEHIEVSAFKTMSVPLAAQVFSHTVAAGIYTLCQLGKLPGEAETTAHFIEQMDQIFNSLNSRSIKSSQKFGSAVSKHSNHMQFFEEALQFFDDVQLAKENKIYCIDGWKLSIKATSALWKDLRDNHHFCYLLTNRLNQDCVENLFSILRGKGGHRDNPSAMEFRAAFRQVAFDHILEQFAGSNCGADMDQILVSLTNIKCSHKAADEHPSVCAPTEQTVDHDHGESEPQNDPSALPLPDSVRNPPNEKLAGLEYLLVVKPPTDIPEQNVEAYLAGYLLRKSKIDSCSTCSSQLIYTRPPDKDLYTFLRNKAYSVHNTLLYPTESFVKFVENIEVLFVKVFDAVKHMTGVLARLYRNIIETKTDYLICNSDECHIKFTAMVKLYIRVRMFHALKMSNRANKNKKGVKRNRKLLKLQHL